MSEKDTGGAAFPSSNSPDTGYFAEGMTLREYAAIKLRVPDSGTDWLDAMILTSLHDEFAAKAMRALIQSELLGENGDIAGASYEVADAMLEARKA